MKQLLLTLALSALLFTPHASIAAIVGDREWLQPADVSGVSWDEIATVCNPAIETYAGHLGDVDLSGWTWASTDDVGDLFRFFVPSFPTGLGEVAEINSVWAPIFFEVFRPTRVTDEFVLLFSWTRTLVPVTSDTPYHAYISSVRDSFPSNHPDNLLNYSQDFRNDAPDNYGAWFYRPLPIALLQQLLEDVAGVGPGKSLVDKVTLAQTYYAVPDIQATCAVLSDLSNAVRAMRGKKIPNELADELSADVQAIMTAIGCD